MKRKKPKFTLLQPVIWQPNPAGVTEKGKHLIGKLMFWIGEIPVAGGKDSSGHCAVIGPDNQLITMLHTPDFRAATDKEF